MVQLALWSSDSLTFSFFSNKTHGQGASTLDTLSYPVLACCLPFSDSKLFICIFLPNSWILITLPPPLPPIPQLQTFLANLISKQMGYLCCWETTSYMGSSPKGVRRKGTYQLHGGMAKRAEDDSSFFSDYFEFNSGFILCTPLPWPSIPSPLKWE